MKWTKAQTKKVMEFIEKAENGCVPVDQWTSGSGRFTKPLALPPFVMRVERGRYEGLTSGIKARAVGFFCENARRKAVYVLDLEAFAAAACEAMQGKEF